MAVLRNVAYYEKKKTNIGFTYTIFTAAFLKFLLFRVIFYFSSDIITYTNECYRPSYIFLKVYPYVMYHGTDFPMMSGLREIR